jgi:hypothetical protein
MVEMRYLLGVVDDRTGSATSSEMAAIDAFNADLQARGAWVLAAGLAAPDRSTVVDATGDGAPTVSEGPFVETAEYVAGFWIIEAPNDRAALAVATDASRACHRRVELRPFL